MFVLTSSSHQWPQDGRNASSCNSKKISTAVANTVPYTVANKNPNLLWLQFTCYFNDDKVSIKVQHRKQIIWKKM